MKTITIKSRGLGRYNDVSPFFVENGKLELNFILPSLSGEFFFVYELNGKTLALPIAEGTVTLTKLTAGELHAEVKHYLRGEPIACYKVEPLILKEVDTALSAMPEIVFLTEECRTLERKTQELESALETAQTHARELAAAFLSYAFADYRTNIQLNAKNLTLEAFAEALGLDAENFSDEEKQNIEKIKEVF